MMCMGVAHELPQSIADKYHFVEMAANTTKPLVFTAASRENLADIYQMACSIAGGEAAFRQNPFIVHYTEPIAPLIPPGILWRSCFSVLNTISRSSTPQR